MKSHKGPLLVVQTSPPFITTIPNVLFKVACNVRVESAGNPLNTTIEWTQISTLSNNAVNESVQLQRHECTPKNPYCLNTISHERNSGNGSQRRYNSAGYLTEFHYQNVLHIAENGTVGVIIYRCSATTQNITTFSDTTVLLNDSSKSLWFQLHLVAYNDD